MLKDMNQFPSDAALGGSMDYLEPSSVLKAVRAQLVDVDLRQREAWQSCRMIEALYHPGRYIRAAYVLTDNPNVPAARSWPEGQVIYLNCPLRQPVSRRGTSIKLGGLDAEVYCFPNDRRLRGLRKFTGRLDAVSQWQTWIDRAGDDFRIDPDSLQRLLVRYVPEQKWLVRLRADDASKSANGASKRRIAVRSASPDVCRKLASLHTSLAQHCSNGSSPFGVPRVVGLAENDAILAVEWIRGDTLIETLRADTSPASLSRVASILSHLHRSTVDGLESLTPQHHLGRLRDAVDDLALAYPDAADRLARLAGTLKNRLAGLDPGQPVSLHADFHWNQLSVKKDRWTLLDLERMTLGDPMVDVANFTVQICMLGVRPEVDVTETQALRWAGLFLEAWCQIGGQRIDADRFRCHAGLALLQLARGMMRHLRPGWLDLTQRCLDRCEKLSAQTGPQVCLT